MFSKENRTIIWLYLSEDDSFKSNCHYKTLLGITSLSWRGTRISVATIQNPVQLILSYETLSLLLYSALFTDRGSF